MNLMIIYKLKNLVENSQWDCNQGFIIRAASEDEARSLAQEQIADEKYTNEEFWHCPKCSSCEEVVINDIPKIILTDFLSG